MSDIRRGQMDLALSSEFTMMRINYVLVFTTAVMAILSKPIYATFYQCEDPSGNTTMTDTPCAETEVQKELIGYPKSKTEHTEHSDSAPTAQARKQQLFGTWRDTEKQGPLSSIWKIDKTYFTESRFGNAEKRYKYHLSDDSIFIHHEPVGIKPWKQQATLKWITPRLIEWTEMGKTVKVYKISQ